MRARLLRSNDKYRKEGFRFLSRIVDLQTIASWENNTFLWDVHNQENMLPFMIPKSFHTLCPQNLLIAAAWSVQSYLLMANHFQNGSQVSSFRKITYNMSVHGHLFFRSLSVKASQNHRKMKCNTKYMDCKIRLTTGLRQQNSNRAGAPRGPLKWAWSLFAH